ncbi:hypothetical protein GRF61_20825 [Azoarcus sp. TTM-91]|nr:hypothetical protein [Azoarcus sp. TTM-91]NMG36901.1 hypothetical protein [Azoarcus sp. TTM-91]
MSIVFVAAPGHEPPGSDWDPLSIDNNTHLILRKFAEMWRFVAPVRGLR